MNQTFSDALYFNDAIRVILTPGSQLIVLSDSLSFFDSLSLLCSPSFLLLVDILHFDDNLSRQFNSPSGNIFGDTFVMTDTIKINMVTNLKLSDSLSFGDTIQVILGINL